ncbi:MAG: hypothetical protein EBV43_05175, partial [Actinobacteria bacterium]|nr:hypothetical protein [Actinomycetota bacterium]
MSDTFTPPSPQSYEGNLELKSGSSPDVPVRRAEAVSNGVDLPVTFYSLGTKVGGPDEANDAWTNRGFSAKGQNLVPG